MPQLNVRIPTQPELDYINDILNDVADKFSNEITTKHLALKKICSIYQKGIDALEFKEIPLNIQETIDAVQCDYIRWDGIIPAFVCFESYHKNKKTHPIENEHDKVINACTLCRKGKSDAIRYRVEEGFRKKGINSIFNLTKLLLRMDTEGAVAQIFLCQAKQFTDDEIIISPDCVHMKCPNLENELVLIEEYCINQIDPSTLNPPCKWLIAPFLRVPIKPAPEARAVMEEMKRLSETTDEEPQQAPKEVEAVMIEVEPKPVEEVEPESVEEVEPEPVEEVESNLSEEEQTKLTELEESEPQTARDIIAKENEEKEKKDGEKDE